MSESDGDPDDSNFCMGMIKATDPNNEVKTSSFELAVTQKETHLHVNTIKSNPRTATLDDLCMISQKLETWLGTIGVSIRTETLQKSILLGTPMIL